MSYTSGMKKLVFKIGGDFLRDAREAFEHPNPSTAGTHTVYVKDAEQIQKILSPERINLLVRMLAYGKKDRSISEIATELNRKQEAISRDLTILEKNGLIIKTRVGQRVRPEAVYSTITIELISN